MQFFKSIIAFTALVAFTSAVSVERGQSSLSFSQEFKASAFKHLDNACEAEDEKDCKEFCAVGEQTATCSANGNKVTCFCKGGKSESNCEERCLLCMPDKGALNEAKELFKLGGSKIEL